MASGKSAPRVAKLAVIVGLLGLLGTLSAISAARSAAGPARHPAAALVTAQAGSDPAPGAPRRPTKPNRFPDYGPQLAESHPRNIPDVDRTKEYSSGRRVRNTSSGAPHFTFYRCNARRCRGAELGSGGWVPIGWFDAGDVATGGGEPTMSPAERAAFEKTIRARMKEPRSPPKPAPRAPPVQPAAPAPAPAAAAPAPAKPAAPAKRSNSRPWDGPHLTEAEMDRIPDVESNKTSWDYNSVRKKRGMTGAGQITSAYRCDDKDGCNSSPGGGPWKPAGWYIVPW